MKKMYSFLIALVFIGSLNAIAQKTWTGATSTAWNLAGNWNPSGIPIATDNVTIPSGTTNSPTVSGSTGGVCNNLTVNSGATLSITVPSGSSTVLTVGGTATFNGALTIGGHWQGNTGKIIAGNVVWNSTSSINAYFGGRMEVSGNYTFASGSSINLGLCWLTFTGGSNSNIYNHSASSSFGNVTLSKTGSAVVYIDASSASTMTIDGVFNINSGSVFIGQPNITTILKGNLVNSGNIYLNSGTLSLEKASGTQDIQVNTNDYFNSLKINTAGTVTLSTSYYLQLKGSMNIQAGVLNPQNNTIALFGDWSNTVGTAGFEEGIGRVNFNGGNYHQYCSNETFFTLEVQKTIGGALRMNGTSVTCSKYDWTAGAIDVINNGTFTVSNQLLDNGIAGNFYLNAGCTINLTNLTGNIDLKGNLYIYGGNFNVYGGINPSWWPSGGNASITMSGGTLDFIDQGMLIKTDATYSFSHNITGGTIRTAGNFACARSDFNPTAGLIEMTGSNNVLLSMTAGSLYNVTINKQTTNTVTLSTDATINGLLLMDEGIFQMNNKVLTTTGNIAVNPGGTFWLDLNAQLKIANNKNITVYSGGLLKVIGTAGNEPVITRNGSIGNYIIHVNSGATIAASQASFYYVNPLRVFSGATIDPVHPFHYCKFRYTSTGMLRIDNSQDLLIRNVEFLGPATGYNVYKSVNSGFLEFKDSYGDYSGPAYENDAYNRIDWTVTQPGLWTGAVSSSWYNADNWDDFTVPGAGIHVTIPGSAPNMPVLDAGTWQCNNLTVDGTITFAGANLTANGNLTMNGLLAMNNASSQFTVLGDVAWNSGSTANITANSIILVNGHWNFNAGSSAQLNNGRVYFQGTSSKWLRNYSTTSSFYHIYVTKTGGAQIGFSDLSTHPLLISGDLQIFANGKFVSDGVVDVILYGNLISDGITQCNGAAFKLDGANQSIKPNTNDYFNHLVFSQTGTASINTGNTTVINVKGNLHIDSGVFNAGSCTINVEGDWDNNVGPTGFTEGGSRVVFKGGNYHQYILQDEDFSTLELNKSSGGALRIQGNSIVNVAAYDWTAGAVDMVNGSFTATTLLDNGIAGNFYVNTGTTVTLGNLSGFPHLMGNLFISGGTMNIIAPIESQWPGNGNASITMSGGELNVYPYGIEIMDDPSYTFTSNITGGTIRTEGAFINHRSDFNPTGGALELYGTQDAGLLMNGGSLFGLSIDKPSNSLVIMYSSITVNGLLTINSGRLKVNNKGITTFDDIQINDGGELWMHVNSEVEILSGKTVNVNYGGSLLMYGSPGDKPRFRINGTGYYEIRIKDGGKISANLARFYDVNPLWVQEGGIIDETASFNNCRFINSNTGMLRIDNNQDLVIHNLEFMGPAAGYNVYKSVNSGILEFKDADGDYSGSAYENDPYNRIHWTYSQPGLWTGAVSSSWYNADNWDDFNIPTAATDVVIPATAPNMPVIDAGEWECNHLDIEGTLTIAGANLTAYGNLTVTGTLAMNAPADQLTVIGNVVWESGSQAAITADVVINVCGNWNFNAGSLAEIDNGMVNFTGNQSKWIRNYSETSRFNDIYVTKISGFQIGFSDLSTEPLLINGKLIVFSNSKFVSDSYEDVILKGDLSSNGITQFNGAALKLDGADQSIIPNTNDYFNHLVFSQTGTVSISTIFTSVINVKGNLHIDSGVFNAGSCTINIEGDWDNNVGPAAFTEGGSRVVFKGGNYHQYIFQDEDFATLEVNKSSGGALRIQTNAIVNVVAYDWTAGAVDMISGSFTATTLLDNGITGSFYVNSGTTVTLGNMSGFPHLKGNLFISGGTMNIIAPIESEWPGNGNASITMSGGELNVYPYGIEIVNNPSYTFTANITGGTIRTEGAFINNRSDFNPAGGTVELYGSDNTSIIMNAGSLQGLTINKPYDKTVTLATNATVNGILTVQSGILKVNNKTLTTLQNVAVNQGGTLWMDFNSQLKISSGKTMNVNDGGLLKVIGMEGNEPVITNNGSGYYDIWVNSGGTIAASRASFYYANPVVVGALGYVDTLHDFDYCKFRYSTVGMLRVENSQDLVIRHAEFLKPATGYNAAKLNNWGSVTFKDSYGDHSGSAFENDPFSRIEWSVSQPGLWTGAVSTDWFDTDNWDNLTLPTTLTDVIIPSGLANMPVINAQNAEVDVKTLTVYGSITVNDVYFSTIDCYISGTLIMNPLNYGNMYVYGDLVWNAGSTAVISSDSDILVLGNVMFNAGSNVQIHEGRLIFFGQGNSYILNQSQYTAVQTLVIHNDNGAVATFSNASTHPLVVDYLQIWTGGIFVSESYQDIVLKNDLINLGGLFQCIEGSFKVAGNNHVIELGANDYFNHLVFSQTGTATINTATSSTLNVKGDLHIDSGMFNATDLIIKIGGNWDNNAGPAAFIETGSRVIFNGGNYHQYLSTDEAFDTLEVDKPLGGALRINNGGTGYTLTCNVYDWTAGAIDAINGAVFTAYGLADDGITGNFYINQGCEINLYQGSKGNLDLNGNYFIYGGNFNVYGSGYSYWGYSSDCSLTMTGGVLNFQDVDISINNQAPYSFTGNISDGSIRTKGGFYVGSNGDFNPSGGNVEIYGLNSGDINNVGGSFYDLIINIETGDWIYCTNAKVTHNTLIQNGRMVVGIGDKLECWNNLEINSGAVFEMYCGGSLRMKDMASIIVHEYGSVVFNCDSDFEYITVGGISPTDYYSFNLTPQSYISARNTIFNNLTGQGIYVAPGATIALANAFNNCIFGYGKSGSTALLTIENNQNLTLENVKFQANNTGVLNNVRKTVDAGSLTFEDAMGAFSGAGFEFDPNNRIHWNINTSYLDAKICLEGPFNGTDMNTNLSGLPDFPLSQPFNTAPWYYNGPESVVTVPTGVVDWVLVELRDAPSAADASGVTVVKRMAALLKHNGSVVATDGYALPDIFLTIMDDLYLVIQHRNHLGVMSDKPLLKTNDTFIYDFTTGLLKAYGYGLGYKKLTDGPAVMVAGDANTDGIILESDKTNVWAPQAGQDGYLYSDFNLDGQVNNSDKNELWLQNISKQCQVPE